MGPRDQSPFCVPLSLKVETNTCISISMQITILSFNIPNQDSQRSLLSLAEDGAVSVSAILTSYCFLGRSHVYMFLNFDFLLLVYFLSVKILAQPEEPRGAEGNFLLPESFLGNTNEFSRMILT